MNNKSNIRAVALSGVFTALSTVFMLLSTFMPFTYLWIMIAGFIMAMLYMEVGQKYTACAFVAASILSFLMVPSLLRTIDFAIFYGFYPSVLLPQVLKINSKKKRFLTKLAIFAVSGAAMFYIGIFITGLNAFSAQLLENGQIFLLVIIGITVIGNFGYDYFLSGMTMWYKESLRARFIR